MSSKFETELKDLGLKIQRARKRQGLSIDALANQAGISKGNLSEIERGLRDPRYSTLMLISETLNLSIGKLIS